MTSDKQLALIRVRGEVGIERSVKDTLTMLKLERKNACVIVKATPANLGMVNKVKHMITWGDVSADSLALLQKDGEKKVYHLHPPRKGYGRKGIKVPFAKGGALGDRGDAINDLIGRMQA